MELHDTLRTAFDRLKNGKTDEERLEAASTIWNVSISNPEELFDSIDTLGLYLSDSDPAVRGLIVWTLYTLSIKDPSTVSSLVDEIGQALLDNDLSVRRYAANILIEVSRDFPEQVEVLTPTLAKALEDPSIDVRVATEKIQQNILAGKNRSIQLKKKNGKPPIVKKTVLDRTTPITDKISISQRINVLEDKVYYRLSVYNNSFSDISDVVCVIVKHPNILKAEQPLVVRKPHVISKTMSEFEFIFKNTKDFLEGTIHATISFLDKEHTIHTISNDESYSIQFAYKFLRKLKKSLEFYEEYIAKTECSFPIELHVQGRYVVGDDVFSRMKRLLETLNIEVIHEESEVLSDIFSGIIKGLSRSIIHRQTYALQLNVLGPLIYRNNAKYFALKFKIVGPDENLRRLIGSDIKKEIMRYMQPVEDIESSEPKQQNSGRITSKSDVSWLNNNHDSKTCNNCGYLLPKTAKYCTECGELQYRSFNE